MTTQNKICFNKRTDRDGHVVVRSLSPCLAAQVPDLSRSIIQVYPHGREFLRESLYKKDDRLRRLIARLFLQNRNTNNLCNNQSCILQNHKAPQN